MTDDITLLPEYQSTMEKLETFKRTTTSGNDYWHARDVAGVLGYAEWRNFLTVIERAREACRKNSLDPTHHFVEFTGVMEVGKGASIEVEDVYVSRLGCYLIAMNGQPSKPEVAAAQAYFAVQARRMELTETDAVPATEDERRVLARDEMKAHNRKLAGAAKSVGVKSPVDYAIFQNHGYKGLYAGLDMRGIQRKKKLGSNQDILDHMPSAELAANLFRATQTAEQLERMRDKGVTGKDIANKAHYDIGHKVRQTIKDIGGTMPEDYPAVEHVKEARKRLKSQSNPPKPRVRKPKTST